MVTEVWAYEDKNSLFRAVQHLRDGVHVIVPIYVPTTNRSPVLD